MDRKQAAVKRLESARSDHQSRVVKLRETQTLNVRKAQAIEVNLDKVEEAISAVNGLVSQGMDWLSIAKLVEQEKKRGNSVAELIGELKLKENLITLMLGEEFDDDTDDDDESGEEVEEDDDDEVDGKKSGSRKNDPKLLTVDLDLSISAWANARSYYEQKKTAAIKEEKTIESSVKALKSTEKKVLADLKKGLKKEKQLLRPVRQQFWFEKFYFFISSDGHLILG